MQLNGQAQKLDNMKGHYFTRRGFEQKVINWKEIDGYVHLVTDLNWFQIPIEKLNQTLQEFLPSDHPENNTFVPVIYNKVKDSDMAQTLMDTINELKGSGGLSKVNIAKAINQTYGTLMQAIKLEMEIKKSMK